MEPRQDTEELYALAYQDDLTGLYNRRYLNRVLARTLQASTEDVPYCLVMMDIDFFKDINDTYGHMNGDRALVAIGKLLSEDTRKEDVPIRFAGDEFVVYLPNTRLEEGLQRAQRLVERAREQAVPLEDSSQEIRVTLSLGVADFPQHGTDWEEVLATADQALYMAKQRGRDCAAPPPREGEKIVRGDDLSNFFPCPTYIGQDNTAQWLKDELRSWLSASHSPHAPVFVVQGAHGSGKTRFLNEFHTTAAAESLSALRVEGIMELQEVCYGSLIRALLLEAGSAESLRKRIEERCPEPDEALWQHFFSPSEQAREPVSSEASDRFFREILAAFFHPDGCTLIIDDLDLLDEDTQRFVQSIHQADTPGNRMFVVAAMLLPDREEDRDEPSADNLFARPDIPSNEIVPLSAKDTKKMIVNILPTLRAPDTFFDQMHSLSGGTPLYIEEAIKYLVQRGQLSFERQAWKLSSSNLATLPRTLRDLIAARIQLLDPEIRDMLEKASVMGANVQPDILPKIDDSNEGYSLDLLNTARRLGVLDGSSLWVDGDFRFHSSTAKDVTHDQLSDENRVAWHLRMAELQETLKSNPDLLQLGPMLYHYQMADKEDELTAIRERLGSFVFAPDAPEPGRKPPDLPEKRKKAKWPDPQPLAQDGVGAVFELFRSLRVTVQTSRLYPETSQIVRKTYESLHGQFEKIFSFSPTIDFAEVEGTLLINGENMMWSRAERALVDAFVKALNDVGLNGIAFASGLTLEELTVFMNTWMACLNLKREPSDAWSAIDKREDLPHIDINARVYVALEEGMIPGAVTVADESGELQSQIEQLGSMIRLLQEKAAKGTSPDEKQLSREEEERFANLIRTLNDVFHAPAGQEVEAPTPSAANSRPTAGQATAPPPTPPSPNEPSLLPAVEEVTESASVLSCISDIVSAEGRREARGYEQLSRMGRTAIEPLYDALSRFDDARSGEVCSEFLKSLDTGFPQRIAREVQTQTQSAVKVRLIRHAVPRIANNDIRKAVLRDALQQDDDSVAREALRQIESLFPQEASAILLHALPVSSAAVQAEICAVLGRSKDETCIEPLLKIVSNWKSAATNDQLLLLEKACQTLGGFGTPPIVEQLELLMRPPSKMPWKKTPPLRVRKAGLMGLERIRTDEVRALLSRYTDDKEAMIRHRVTRILKDMKSGT